MSVRTPLDRLRDLAAGWRGSQAALSLTRADAAYLCEQLGEPAEDLPDVVTVGADELCRAVDRIAAIAAAPPTAEPTSAGGGPDAGDGESDVDEEDEHEDEDDEDPGDGTPPGDGDQASGGAQLGDGLPGEQTGQAEAAVTPTANGAAPAAAGDVDAATAPSVADVAAEPPAAAAGEPTGVPPAEPAKRPRRRRPAKPPAA